MELKLVENEPKFYEFIRKLRTDEDNIDGFLERVQITPEQQIKYMEKYDKCYFICLNGETPVGFIGVVDDDIRVCTNHQNKGQGVGYFMLTEIMKLYPDAKAKILEKNVASINLFKKSGFVVMETKDGMHYLKNKI